MKSLAKVISIIFFSICFTFFCQAQSSTACSTYYPFSEGITWQISTYDKKDKLTATTDYSIKELTTSADNQTATIGSVVKDKEGEIILDSDFGITCDGSGISIDINSLFNPQTMGMGDDIDADITGTNILIPNNLKKGDVLPDADMTVKMNVSGVGMTMIVEMTDRKVEDIETITVPAGSFECYVISYTTFTKMGIGKKGLAKQWIAKEVGMVKQEDYNKKGKVVSKSLLTKFN